jgi:hypothetical protein
MYTWLLSNQETYWNKYDFPSLIFEKAAMAISHQTKFEPCWAGTQNGGCAETLVSRNVDFIAITKCQRPLPHF